ncbi:hypothetical protein [Rheinheimera sp. WS51]|uniref:hypothetical protein n=1 Tax=Rheinheimera sp. WS51 TaxID=3425886 RepID=UPI003D8C8FCE
MKSTTIFKTIAISTVFIAVVSLFFVKSAAQECYDLNVDNAKSCVQAHTQSWLSWIKGQSRSTQFHFVDLLELINRVSPANKA